MIALIGMSGVFPDALSVDELWQAILEGRTCIRRFGQPELSESDAQDVVSCYVPARGWFDGLYGFDADFFGYSPAEAAMVDPQQRLFLQEAWRALEDAGYRPDRIAARVGVFAGCGINTHLLFDLLSGTDATDDDAMSKVLGNEKDFLASRVSYKLGLKGPSVNVQTACSTSLAAVHLGCQSLLLGECDMVLAGGASVYTRKDGYRSQPGGILSPDGVCRPFDAVGQGFVPGNGVGVVCLKRLKDAVTDGDHIRLVIRGSAINNDGRRKAGFTAPSVDGQVEAIREALAVADAPAGSIGFVETHGTGTNLGDPIEFEALRRGLDGFADPEGCALGALKANIGHLDTAAGVAALIKTAFVVESGNIPPLANLQTPNPLLSLQDGMLTLPRAQREWSRARHERWACVNGLGLGGTNVYVVVSGAPERAELQASNRLCVVPVSARSEEGLERTLSAVARRLDGADATTFRDATFTLGMGRYSHRWRRALLGRDALEVAESCRVGARPRPISPHPHPVLLFPGGGAQHPNMARGLFAAEPVFRKAYLECSAHLGSAHGIDLQPDRLNADNLLQPVVGLAGLFVVEWALAQLWSSWGLKAKALLGHSAGEYAAAAMSGVFSLRDALDLVVTRARLMETLPPGGMLTVQLSEAEALRYCEGQIGLAAVNSPTVSVLAGPAADLERLSARLRQDDVIHRRVDISVAAHSPVMDTVAEAFAAHVATLPLCVPSIKIISSATGRALTDAEATNPRYWGDHLRQTVRFKAGLEMALNEGANVFIEVGPGQGLTTLGREVAARAGNAADFVATLPAAGQAKMVDDNRHALQALASAWERGIDFDWEVVNGAGHRLSMPATEFLTTEHRPPPKVGGFGAFDEAGMGLDRGSHASPSLAPPQGGSALRRHRGG